MGATITIVVIAIVVVAIGVVIGVLVSGRRRTALRERFGPEYERTVEAEGSPKAAEAQLRSRVKERESIDVHPLSDEARDSYLGEWRLVQAGFVDRPDSALGEADGLVQRVMRDRGYPVDDFERQAELVSVDHPVIVEQYRVAHGVFEAAGDDGTSTEELRKAMVAYKELFTELLDDRNEDRELEREEAR
jgi:hypothetical protein